jgi:hypothetical protein
MAKKLSGGGIQSNKLARPGIKSGPPRTNVVSPASADQIGQTVAFKKDPLPIRTAPQVPMGNAVALNVGKGSPGAGRTTHHCGSQGRHGSPVAGEARQGGSADRGPRSILNEPKGS